MSEFRGFDHTLEETYHWLHEIGVKMNNPNRHMAYHALRGVLFALRDRLPIEEAVQLAAQLPMLMRGIFFEGYRPAGKPDKFHAEEFLARVEHEIRLAGHAHAETAVRAVLSVLSRHVSAGEIKNVYESLPRDLRRLWPED